MADQAMTTPDGWRVEVVEIAGRTRFRIKRYGSLAFVGRGVLKGCVDNLDQVR